jgi:hypothetical protein
VRGAVASAPGLKRREGKIAISPMDACARAEAFVIAAGFELAHQSTMSEARYFRFPGRHGLIRIATHRKGGRHPHMPEGPTLASINFNEVDINGMCHLTAHTFEWSTATAIGLFMIRSGSTDMGSG